MKLFLRVLSVLLLAALPACDAARDASAPELTSPQFDVVNDGSRQYTLVEGEWRAGVREASAWIDRHGGVVIVPAGADATGQMTFHAIWVPNHAVKNSTLFVIRVIPSRHIQFRLEAYERQKNGEIVSVGARGFREPVYLVVTYAYASNVADPTRLRILYDPETGAPHQRLQTFLFPNEPYVLAPLTHFSKYVLAME